VEFCKAFFCDIAFGGKRFPSSSSAADSVEDESGRRSPVSKMRELEIMIKMVKDEKEEGWSIKDVQEFDVVLKRVYDVRFCRAEKLGERNAIANDHHDTKPISTDPFCLCWVPLEAEASGIIVVIHGFRMPMLMRGAIGLVDRYRFLGIR
jgi:hypothetical protein